jgi:hypothetical protein
VYVYVVIFNIDTYFMIKFITPVLLILSAVQMVDAQTPVHHDVQRMMREKLRGYDLNAAIQWIQSNPNQPLPPNVWIHENTVNDRDAEVVVSGNDAAESEVHAAINPTDSNNIITSAILQDPEALLNPLDVPIRYTTNFGQTWSTSNIEFSPNASLFAIAAGGGDPVIAFDKSGKAYISWLVLTLDPFADPPVKLAMYASQSTNKGQTWSDPVSIDFGTISIEGLTGEGAGSLVDKQWMACDQSNSTHEGNLYVSYTRFDIIDSITATAKILLKRKLKSANAFAATAVQVHTNEYPFMQFSSIDVDGSGNVHVLFTGGNTEDDIALYHAVSTNGGVSFAPETKISDIHFPSLIDSSAVNPIAGMADDRMYPCPHLRAGKEQGLLYATWSSDGLTSQLTEGYDVWFTKSTDGGATWAAPKTINAGTNPLLEQFYPALTVSPTGVVCIGYYDRTGDPTGTNTHYALTYSFDEGENFTAPVNATTVASDFAEIGALNGGFGIGEYTQVVCAPNTAIPVWADGRSNNGDIDIYAAFFGISDGPSSVQTVGTITDAFSIQMPNPVSRVLPLQIDLKKPTKTTVEIWGNDGRLVYQNADTQVRSIGNFNVQIPLTTGQYICRVSTQYGWKATKVIVL